GLACRPGRSAGSGAPRSRLRTGRYSRELARRGYIVHGVDLSAELIGVAKGAVGDRTGGVSFAVADILAAPSARYAALLCRGVLNDIIDDDRRDAVFAAFARTLRPYGALILDVREWGASAERKTREPLFRKRVSTDRGELTYTSVTELDAERRLLLISERHELVGQGDERVSDYQFVMRCWEREELGMLFARRGFGNIEYFGAYDHRVEIGATDRLVAVAQLSNGADTTSTLEFSPRTRERRFKVCSMRSRVGAYRGGFRWW